MPQRLTGKNEALACLTTASETAKDDVHQPMVERDDFVTESW